MQFTLNGRAVEALAHPMTRLLDVVREEFGLTGTKEGCGEGECGACTVLLDGLPVNACLVPVAHAAGREVVTIEGLAGHEPLQEAFIREGGAQCGICTPGFIVAASVLPTGAGLDQVREALAGNICRCTGYGGIYRSVASAVGAAGADDGASGSGLPALGSRSPNSEPRASSPDSEPRAFRPGDGLPVQASSPGAHQG